MNSVLQQFLVGKEEQFFSDFVEKSFNKTKILVFVSQRRTTLNEYNQSLMKRNMV